MKQGLRQETTSRVPRGAMGQQSTARVSRSSSASVSSFSSSSSGASLPSPGVTSPSSVSPPNPSGSSFGNNPPNSPSPPNPSPGNPSSPPAQPIQMHYSDGFIHWFSEQNVSLGFSTYRIGKTFVIGRQPDNQRLSIYERTFNHSMGFYGDTDTLYMSFLTQLWRFENMLSKDEQHQGYDKLYKPQVAYTTGDIDIHDIGLDKATNTITFVSTLFNCVATTSVSKNFELLWKPPFITDIVAEDRCHLNGLAFREGRPRYVTMVSQTNTKQGWREHRNTGGIVMDITTNEIIAQNLSMPHSPRWHNGKLWLLNSGRGELGYIENNQFKPVAFCQGFARGLRFCGDYAIVGLSRSRHNDVFKGLHLETLFTQNPQLTPLCGMAVIDLNQKKMIHHFLIQAGHVDEIYDVAVLPGVTRPMLLGFRGNDLAHFINFEDNSKQTLVPKPPESIPGPITPPVEPSQPSLNLSARSSLTPQMPQSSLPPQPTSTASLPAQLKLDTHAMITPSQQPIQFSDALVNWLSEQDISLGLSTHHSGKTFLLGRVKTQSTEQLSICQRTFNHSLSFCGGTDVLYLNTLAHIWRFDNMVPPGGRYQGHDKLYKPQAGYTTGDIGICDIGTDKASNRIVFVSSLLNCVATVNQRKSVEVIWKPPFITDIVTEDRCHLTGLAFQEGRPRYVTMGGQTNIKQGWQRHLTSGGVVMDITTNEVIAKNLSMPHSPRWHNGKLWLLNSGRGELGYIENNQFNPIAFCQGFARGLQFCGDYAVVGLSKFPQDTTSPTSALPLTGIFKDNPALSPVCGMVIIDINTHKRVHHFLIQAQGIDDIFDVAILPKVSCPMLLDFQGKELEYMIHFEDKREQYALTQVLSKAAGVDKDASSNTEASTSSSSGSSGSSVPTSKPASMVSSTSTGEQAEGERGRQVSSSLSSSSPPSSSSSKSSSSSTPKDSDRNEPNEPSALSAQPDAEQKRVTRARTNRHTVFAQPSQQPSTVLPAVVAGLSFALTAMFITLMMVILSRYLSRSAYGSEELSAYSDFRGAENDGAGSSGDMSADATDTFDASTSFDDCLDDIDCTAVEFNR